MDDLKLFVEKDDVLNGMVEEMRALISVVGLEMNWEKCGTKSGGCESSGVLLGGNEGYK